jgi:hypothetical protein
MSHVFIKQCKFGPDFSSSNREPKVFYSIIEMILNFHYINLKFDKMLAAFYLFFNK